jgi:hypothetical protein
MVDCGSDVADTSLHMRFVALFVFLQACAGPATGPRTQLPGLYRLATVNGDACPAVGCVIAVVPPEVIRLTRASVLIRADSTFSDTTVITYDRSPFGGIETETQVREGRWTPEEYEWRGDTLVRFEPRRLPLMPLTLKYVRH